MSLQAYAAVIICLSFAFPGFAQTKSIFSQENLKSAPSETAKKRAPQQDMSYEEEETLMIVQNSNCRILISTDLDENL